MMRARAFLGPLSGPAWPSADPGALDPVEAEEHGEPFEAKIRRLTADLKEPFAESDRLTSVIRENLSQFANGV